MKTTMIFKLAIGPHPIVGYSIRSLDSIGIGGTRIEFRGGPIMFKSGQRVIVEWLNDNEVGVSIEDKET